MVTLRAASVAGPQEGTVSRAQLLDCGWSDRSIRRARDRGRLHPHPLGLPGIYLLGHTHATRFANLVAALLHAGTRSALTDATALWWYDLLSEERWPIHVATAGRARSCGRVVVHRPGEFAVVRLRRLPVVPVAQALRQFAAHASHSDVRQALSEAEFRGRLDIDAIRGETGQGRPGSRRLQRALARHEPRLARTQSDLEKLFLEVCERFAVPLPVPNREVGWMTVDAVWPEIKLAVEIDGHGGHRTRAQMNRDRRRELELRRRGFIVVRYTEAQLEEEPELVARDLLQIMERLSAV